MTNEWMQDESLQNIDPYKLEFLQALVFESSNLRKEQLLPFLRFFPCGRAPDPACKKGDCRLI